VAPSERRVPGSILVLVLVVVGIVFAALVVVLRPASVLGPPLFLIMAESTITITPDDPRVPAAFGPHCTPYRWLERRGALAADTDQDLAGVEGLLLQHFAVPATGFQWDGGDAVRAILLTTGMGWNLTSPVDGRVLATLARDGTNLTIGPTTYAPGTIWSLRFEYDVSTLRGFAHVVEDIIFQNRGVVPTHLTPPAACA